MCTSWLFKTGRTRRIYGAVSTQSPNSRSRRVPVPSRPARATQETPCLRKTETNQLPPPHTHTAQQQVGALVTTPGALGSTPTTAYEVGARGRLGAETESWDANSCKLSSDLCTCVRRFAHTPMLKRLNTYLHFSMEIKAVNQSSVFLPFCCFFSHLLALFVCGP